MLITRVGEPPLPSVGDVWFDPTTLQTQVYQGTNGPGGPLAPPWSPILPMLSMPSNPMKGYIYVDAFSNVPSFWDGQQWISAVPPGYQFPPKSPPTGTIWIEQMTQTPYIWMSNKWMATSNPTAQSPTPPNYFQFQNSTATPPVLSIPGNNSNVSIFGPNGSLLVEIDTATGKITYGQGYSPDAAAQIFWRALAGASPRFLQTQIAELVKDLRVATTRLAVAEGQVLKFTQMGYKIPEPPKPFDAMEAWNRAMGIIK